jgi:hypothetical protein
MKSILRVDWATHEAAKYAVLNWHYSKCLPAGKLVKVGAWENDKFIGAVLFARGATPNLGKPYGLNQDACCELVRVALTRHIAPVSRIVALSIKFLKKSNPRLRLVVSFADQSQGHHGGIYQAGNWIYTGSGQPATFYKIKGKMTHPRTIGSAGYVQNLSGARQIDPRATAVLMPGKHRYLMPFDTEMRSKILPLARPYPKRARSDTKDTPGFHPGEGGSTPTLALHSQAT